jgi:ATP-dependent RNA helicase DHX36
MHRWNFSLTGKQQGFKTLLVGAYPLLLFGGKVKVDYDRAQATCDGWIHFRAAPRVAVLFKALRTELDGLLMQKIASPELNIAQKSGDLVKTIVELLETENAVVGEAKLIQKTADAAALAAFAKARGEDVEEDGAGGKGLHSSTSLLNLSRFCH